MSGFAFAPLRGAAWRDGGLRSYMSYRDLGVGGASGGMVGAQHIRVTQASGARTGWHYHGPDFQLVYVLKGWARVDAQGTGLVELRAGDSAVLPPGLAHDEIGYSEDFEVLEVTLPAERRTIRLDAPPAETPDAPIVVSRDRSGAYRQGDGPRAFLAYRDLGASESTGRRVQAQVVRTGRPCDASTGWHYHTLDCQFVYVLAGSTSVDVEDEGHFDMLPGDAMTIPRGRRHDVTAFSSDFAVFELNVPADFDTVPA